MKPRWKQYLLYVSLIIVVGLLAWFLIQPVLENNTGFENKSLWDRLELLVVPMVLAVGAFYLERADRNTEREITKDRQQEAALQTYLDQMADLLLNEKLRTSEREEVWDVARLRTLIVLGRLDKWRKRTVLLSLLESRLITKDPVINLFGANLSGADLRRLKLSGVKRNDVTLSNADLSGTDLSDVNLNGADLDGANLSGANLQGADLSGADLTGAKISKEQLVTVKSLKGAIMPDGTKHD
jgi:hypothetical protein